MLNKQFKMERAATARNNFSLEKQLKNFLSYLLTTLVLVQNPLSCSCSSPHHRA